MDQVKTPPPPLLILNKKSVTLRQKNVPQSYGLGLAHPPPLRKNSITNLLFSFDGFPY